METKILCPQWGLEHLPVEDFFSMVKNAGYDGVDTWLPERKEERREFVRLLEEYDLSIVSHQHQAHGRTIAEFCKSFEYYLELSLECEPILINSHSGRDYFTLDEQLQVIDVAQNFAAKNNIRVAHETHRGRIGFSPVNLRDLFKLRPEMKITADFSHWVCVTESFLEMFGEELDEAIHKTEHIHARVGFTEGPQIPDPRLPNWQQPVRFFMDIWKKILEYQRSLGTNIFTVTPEFGPPPYMWTNPETSEPITNQWEVNRYMKDLLQSL
ncbi:MAG: sugar phosphate isomerase/epimerase family protein [Ginsengibacter sp.]